MTRAEVYKVLNRVFQDVFDDPDIRVYDDTVADDIDGWDSLEHINLISAVEKKFKMRFKMKEVSTMKDVGEMVDIIMARMK